MVYGATMFKSLLLISCLVFVVGCGDESVSEPTVWLGDATADNLDVLIAGRYIDITGSLIVSGSQTGILTVPQLRSVGGRVEITHNTRLTRIDLPQLQSVGGFFKLSDNHSLTSLNMPRLQSVGGAGGWWGGGFSIFDNDNLTDCDLGSYTEENCPR